MVNIQEGEGYAEKIFLVLLTCVVKTIENFFGIEFVPLWKKYFGQKFMVFF